MKRILLIAHHSLYPIDSGFVIRVIEQAKFLSRNGFEVHVIGGKTRRDSLRKVVEAAGGEIHAYSSSLIRRIDNFLNMMVLNPSVRWNNPLVRYDFLRIIKAIDPHVVQFEFLYLANQTSGIAKDCNIPTVLATHNVEHVRLIQEGFFDRKHREALKSFEKDVCNSVDLVTTVSEEDKCRLVEIGVRSRITVVPNGVDYKRYQVSEEDRESLRRKYEIGKNEMVLVFHGTLNYRPNREANDLLINSIFPELMKTCGNLRLLLIGPGHQKEIGRKIVQLPAIPFEMLPLYLGMGDIGVVPLMAGSGTRLKIIEYMALGIPTVSTETGVEGLPVTDGENIIVARDAGRDFTQETIKLLEDEESRKRIAENGKRLAKESLDWNVIFRQTSLRAYDDLLTRA